MASFAELDPRDAHLARTLGADALAKIRSSRVLVVGAGGIGCELMKNLVLSGFQDIEVIDLDTIDVSNLNRQFLFRPQHVGQPKAHVAREVALTFNTRAKIVSHHANVKDAAYGVGYVSGFDLVFNALDNVPARKHVNRLCLAAKKPLIEAGTSGYLGQAVVIKGGVTQCYECQPLPAQKKFPICTIRSTPDRPVHCVVWAKELHKLLFGDAKTSYLYEADASEMAGASAGASSSDSGAAAGGAGAASGAAATGEDAAVAGAEEPRGESVYMHVVKAAPVPTPAVGAAGGSSAAAGPTDAAAIASWCRRLFDAVFGSEIEKRLEMAPETYKTAAVRPLPLFADAAEAGKYDHSAAAAAGDAGAAGAGSSAGAAAAGGAGRAATAAPAGGLADQRILSVAQSASLFLASLARYYSDGDVCGSLGSLDFSKDSPLDLDFVTAATNLRAATFGIPLQSRFAVKSIAGNIVPAIATTNAIVAGLEVLEAIKILRGDDIIAKCRNSYILRAPGNVNQLIMPSRTERPAAGCFVCGRAGVSLFIDTHKATLRDLIDKVLKGGLGFNAPNIDNGDGFNFVEERDPDEDDDEYEQKMSFLDVPLAKLVGGGLKDGMTAECADFGQGNLNIAVSIRHRDTADFDEMVHPQFFELVGAGEAVAAAARAEAARAEKVAAAAAAASGAGSAAAAGSSAAAGAAGKAPAVGSKRSRVQEDEAGTLHLSDSDDDGGKGSAGAGARAGAAPAAKRAREEAADDEGDVITLDD